MNIKLVNKETDAMGIPMTQNTIIIEIEMRLMNIPQKINSIVIPNTCFFLNQNSRSFKHSI